jgi:hypothetical protein
VKQPHPQIDLGSRWQRCSRWGDSDPKHIVVVIRATGDRFWTKREGDFDAKPEEWCSVDAFLDCYAPAPDSLLPPIRLSSVQRRVLLALGRLCAKLGRPPKMREIADECGMKATTQIERVFAASDHAGFTMRSRGLGGPLRQRELTPRGIAALREEAIGEAAE